MDIWGLKIKKVNRKEKGERKNTSKKAIKFKYQGQVEIWEGNIRFIMSGMDKRSETKKIRK